MVGRTLIITAVLLTAGLPMGAQAQSALEEQEILVDEVGDLEVSSAGTSIPDNGRFQRSDLVGLYVSETPEDILFRIQVADVDPEQEIMFLEQGAIITEFALGEDDSEASTGAPSSGDPNESGSSTQEASRSNRFALEIHHHDGGAFGYLSRYDPAAERFVDRAYLDAVTVDPATDSFIASVPRDDLLDRNGAAVAPEIPLHSFFTYSVGWGNGLFMPTGEDGFFDVKDQMPDDGEPMGEFVPVLGVKQTGHLHLSSPAPVRASNGEATTYVYDVTLRSDADFIDDVALAVVGAPTNWQVKLPASSVRIDNETIIHMPVLVTTPFGHEHGSFENFIVEARSARDPSAVGRVEIGVRYTEIPQPAGHHSMLWLHSRSNPSSQLNEAFSTIFGGGNAVEAYFNPAAPEDDERDEALPVPPTRRGGAGFLDEEGRPASMEYQWRVFLEPTLQIGLDFDINGTGELTVPFVSELPLRDASLEGTLYYLGADQTRDSFFSGQEALTLGTFAPSDLKNGGAGQTVMFETTFTPDPAADFILYQPQGATMWMELRLTIMHPATLFVDGAISPELAPGGELTLPLNEYHDPVDDLYNQLTDVEVIMESDQEQYVNSGETILFEVRIKNTGVVNDEFQVILGGVNEEWATLLGDPTFSVRSGESRRVVVAVHAPFTSSQGETADLVLEAISKSDDNARALVRLFAEVDNLIDHEDKSHLVPITHSELTYTPVGPWLAPLALLGAFAVLRRTRRL